MGIYADYLLPKIVHFACSAKAMDGQRDRVIPRAQGTVLEVGIGSGLNLAHYDASRISRVIGIDPSSEMLRMAERAAEEVPFDVELARIRGEEIPLEDNSVDTVLLTYTLCTIGDTEQALWQMGRVLKPGGRLLFCEHGASPDAGVRRWQDIVNPVWGKLGGGCHLNRDIPGLIEAGGFHIVAMERMYIPGWRPLSYNFLGAAECG